jgi:agmatinase
MAAFYFPQARFLGAETEPEAAEVVIFGAPMDGTVTFRPGARLAPGRIRELSVAIETYSPYQDLDLERLPVADLGDLLLPLADAASALKLIRETADEIYSQGKIPAALGGEHLISLPLIEAAFKKHPDLCVLHLDAHTDLRDTWEGEKLSHSTVMRRVVETVGAGRLWQLGVRSGTGAEFAYARQVGHMLAYAEGELASLVEVLNDRPVYLSLDIDVLDPAYAPGTGTPEAGGFSSKELLRFISTIVPRLNICGFDLVEVAPNYDEAERTCILAATLLRELAIAAIKSVRRSVRG